MLPLEIKFLITELYKAPFYQNSFKARSPEQQALLLAWLTNNLPCKELYGTGEAYVQDYLFIFKGAVVSTEYIQVDIPVPDVPFTACTLSFKKLAFLKEPHEDCVAQFDPYFTACKQYVGTTEDVLSLTELVKRQDLEPEVLWNSAFLLLGSGGTKHRLDKNLPPAIEKYTAELVGERNNIVLKGLEIVQDKELKCTNSVRGISTTNSKKGRVFFSTVLRVEETFNIKLAVKLPNLSSEHDRLAFLSAY